MIIIAVAVIVYYAEYCIHMITSWLELVVMVDTAVEQPYVILNLQLRSYSIMVNTGVTHQLVCLIAVATAVIMKSGG